MKDLDDDMWFLVGGIFLLVFCIFAAFTQNDVKPDKYNSRDMVLYDYCANHGAVNYEETTKCIKNDSLPVNVEEWDILKYFLISCAATLIISVGIVGVLMLIETFKRKVKH